jgi:8-oxo-dGTP pyrophosphatase MutT (NUDIX family)
LAGKEGENLTEGQVAALPVRRTKDGTLEVLLVTSKSDGEWMIPKGARMPALNDAMAAAREALEEAGVKGCVQQTPIGFYIHHSDRRGAVVVSVYKLVVEEQLSQWQEQKARRRVWASLGEAAALTTQPGLKQFLLGLD